MEATCYLGYKMPAKKEIPNGYAVRYIKTGMEGTEP